MAGSQNLAEFRFRIGSSGIERVARKLGGHEVRRGRVVGAPTHWAHLDPTARVRRVPGRTDRRSRRTSDRRRNRVRSGAPRSSRLRPSWRTPAHMRTSRASRPSLNAGRGAGRLHVGSRPLAPGSRIDGVRAVRLVSGEVRRQVLARHRGALGTADQLEEPFTIDREVQRAPHVYVVERRHRRVEGEEERARCGEKCTCPANRMLTSSTPPRGQTRRPRSLPRRSRPLRR